MKSQKNRAFTGNTILLHLQTVCLKEGLTAKCNSNVPTEEEVLKDYSFNSNVMFGHKIHRIVRACLFREFDGSLIEIMNVGEVIAKKQQILRPLLLFAAFFEGLISFTLARQTRTDCTKWIQNGKSIMDLMKCWEEHSMWNWENKVFLLEAEYMYSLGNIDKAVPLYEKAIRSAHVHHFVHEAAIASEHAGMFYFDRGLHASSLPFLLHAVQSYKTWGALVVAKRVENIIEESFDPNLCQLASNDDTITRIIASTSEAPSKKRQASE